MGPHRIVGVWRLISQVYEDAQTGERVPIFGERPSGRQIASPGGRWLALATGQDRPTPLTDADHVSTMRSMISYTGRYRVEGDVVTTKIEAAWNPKWIGTEQVRYLQFESDDLVHIVSPPMPHPNVPGREVRVLVTWAREE